MSAGIVAAIAKPPGIPATTDKDVTFNKWLLIQEFAKLSILSSERTSTGFEIAFSNSSLEQFCRSSDLKNVSLSTCTPGIAKAEDITLFHTVTSFAIILYFFNIFVRNLSPDATSFITCV